MHRLRRGIGTPSSRIAVLALALLFGLASVTIAPAAHARNPRLVAAGDIAYRLRPSRGQLGTTRLIERLDPVAVLALGDTQYRSGTIAEYLRSYDPTWGRFLSKTFPVPGNHEYNTPRAAGFFRYFGPRTFGGRGYYSFNRGGWHLVALDSVRGRRPDERQLRWLRRDLVGNDATCELAFFHHPLFTSGLGAPASPDMAVFWRILFRHGVDVVLNGHAHSYERFVKLTPGGKRSPRGIREIVVGTGGIGVDQFGDPIRGSQVRIRRFGVLSMQLLRDAYRWRFVATDGRSLDRGSTGCRR
ncbi:MAG: metallophosphoesterase [Actinomycetota bacterium]